jgi:hypothetical protein
VPRSVQVKQEYYNVFWPRRSQKLTGAEGYGQPLPDSSSCAQCDAMLSAPTEVEAGCCEECSEGGH